MYILIVLFLFFAFDPKYPQYRESSPARDRSFVRSLIRSSRLHVLHLHVSGQRTFRVPLAGCSLFNSPVSLSLSVYVYVRLFICNHKPEPDSTFSNARKRVEWIK